MRIKAAANVCVSRTGGRIKAGHAAVAPGGEHHRRQRDENRHDDVAEGSLVGRPEYPDRSNRLDQHDAIEDQVAKAEDAAEPGRRLAICRAGRRRGGGSRHWVVLHPEI